MTDNVLITGGAGFVGSHVCKALAQTGYRPVVYDNLSKGHRWAVQWGPLEIGDLSDRKRLADVIARYKPVAVMHFAASTEAGHSVRAPGSFYENNVANTLGLLQIMLDQRVTRIVFSSSAAVYGDPVSLPMTEDHPKAPVNPYGETKLMCEKILADFGVAHGIRSISLRYFNAAAADQEGCIGEAHEPETHLIPLVLDTAAGNRSHISIFGDDYDTPDGTCIRDYIHVSDLAEAHRRALVRTEKIDTAEALNLGTGRGHSVLEVIAAAEQVTAQRIPTKRESRRAGDPPSLVADPTAAKDMLDWTPQWPDLETQIADAWRWHQVHTDGAAAVASQGASQGAGYG